MINQLAVLMIVFWAFWCLLSPKVSDGLVGKVLYLLLGLAALGVLSNPDRNSETILNCTFAALGVRHVWMKLFFPKIRCAVIGHIHECTKGVKR